MFFPPEFISMPDAPLSPQNDALHTRTKSITSFINKLNVIRWESKQKAKRNWIVVGKKLQKYFITTAYRINKNLHLLARICGGERILCHIELKGCASL
jgi:hypothetical protein